MTALLSVVIPTYRRQEYLQRAIASALDCTPEGEVEVLVVPNGPDTSWHSVAQHYKTDARVHWLPLALGNASAARNHGMSHAKSKYIRFLDDDDFLYPAAADQLQLIEERGADLCSSPLRIILAEGRGESTLDLPKSDDFPTAALLAASVSLTQGTIFRGSLAQSCRWREDIVLYDDYLWMLTIARNPQLVWLRFQSPTASYVQHYAPRLSQARRSRNNSRPLVESVLDLHALLNELGRNTPERRRAAASALLTHAHSAFPTNPIFLSGVIGDAKVIAADARPIQPLFQDHAWLSHHLLLLEWIMIPPRYLTRAARRAFWIFKRLTVRSRYRAPSSIA